MTPDQMAELESHINLVAASIIVLQAIMGIIILSVCRRIAKNEVELGDLIRQAVDKLESDLPAKK
jgi:hypothetical protein